MSNKAVQSIIDIENTHAYRTIEAFKQAYKEKGLEPEPEKDFPRDERKQLERLRRFDAHVDLSKPISRKIISMVRQPVYIRENGKNVTKDALKYEVRFEGHNHGEIPITASCFYGYYLRPNLQFSVKDFNNPYDPKTGQKIGRYQNYGSIFEYTIFLSEKKDERVKFLNNILDSNPETFLEELVANSHLLYRRPNGNNNFASQRGSAWSWKNFTELSIEQLSQLQGKGYYTDSKNTLRDKDGSMVEYNRSTGKVTAIQ